MKKIIAGLAVAVCLLSTISAQITVTPEAKAIFDKTIQIDPKTKKPYDFGGMEIQITDWWSDPAAPAKTENEKKQKMWEQWIRDTYNVNIYRDHYDTADWGKILDLEVEILKNAGSDSKNYILNVDGRNVIDLQDKGYIADLGKIKSVDFKNPKYNQSICDRIRKGKSFYTFNVGKSEIRDVIFYNKQLIRDAGFDGDFPYELQKLGKWNWKNFELLLNAVTKDDHYGICGAAATMGNIAVVSNGSLFVTKDKNGGFINTSTDSKTIAAINWIRDINNKYGFPGGEQWDAYKKSFASGESCFIVEQLCEYAAYKNVLKADFDIGVVGFPVGPNGGKTVKTSFDDNMLVLPSVYDSAKADKIMKAFDLYSEKCPLIEEDLTGYEFYTESMDSRTLQETLPILYKNGVIRYDTIIPDVNPDFVIWGIIWKGSDVDAANAFGDKKAEWNAKLKECKID